MSKKDKEIVDTSENIASLRGGHVSFDDLDRWFDDFFFRGVGLMRMSGDCLFQGKRPRSVVSCREWILSTMMTKLNSRLRYRELKRKTWKFRLPKIRSSFEFRPIRNKKMRANTIIVVKSAAVNFSAHCPCPPMLTVIRPKPLSRMVC